MCVSRSGSSTTTISCRHIEDVSTRGRVIERRLVAGSDFEDMIETAARPGLYVHSWSHENDTTPEREGTCVPPPVLRVERATALELQRAAAGHDESCESGKQQSACKAETGADRQPGVGQCGRVK